MAVTNKLIQLKDKDANLLFPKVLPTSIPAKAITKAQLADEVTNILNSAATNASLQALKNDVDILKGASTVVGSVDQKVKTAVDNLVGTAPNTLNTLQKIAEEMQDPANNTASTVLDQVASKANSTDLTAEVNRAKEAEAVVAKTVSDEAVRAKAAEKANADKIAANTDSINNETTRAEAAEKTNSDAIAAINAKLLTPMLTFDEVTE